MVSSNPAYVCYPVEFDIKLSYIYIFTASQVSCMEQKLAVDMEVEITTSILSSIVVTAR